MAVDPMAPPDAPAPDAGIHPDLAALAVPIAALAPLPGNPRVGDVEAVMRSYAMFGQRKPIVARREGGGGIVLAGNHQLEAARRLGWPSIAVVWVDDDDLTAKAFALADNRTADLGSYDDEALAAMLAAIADSEELMAAASFSVAEFEAIAGLGGGTGGLSDPDEVPEPPPAPVSARGDVWLLGRHRLVCGDSTDPDVFEALMGGGVAQMVWTDPPYGVAYVGKTKDALTIKNDLPGQTRALVADAMQAATPHIEPGSSWYVAAPAGPLGTLFRLAIMDAGWTLHQVLVWVKDMFVLGHSDYHYRHEDILYGWVPGPGRSGRGNHAGSRWEGDHAADTVFEIPRPKRSEEHPTMKPVALIEVMVRNSSRGGDVVLDPFGGSGSTLIAAHSLGRVARLVELDPGYCDVICRRYQQHTGEHPVLEATGEPHDFEAAT